MPSREADVDFLRLRVLRTKRVVAYARPPLIEFLRERVGAIPTSPRLILKDIISRGPGREAICHFMVEGDRHMRSFFAPLIQLSLGPKQRSGRNHKRRSRQSGPERMK